MRNQHNYELTSEQLWYRKMATLSVAEILKLQERIKDDLRHINKLRSNIQTFLSRGDDNCEIQG